MGWNNNAAKLVLFDRAKFLYLSELNPSLFVSVPVIVPV